MTSGQQKKKSTNVSTLQRLNVATSLRFLPQNHKKQRRPNFEIIEERKEESMKNEATMTGIIGEDNCFVFFFSDKLLMIYRIMGAVNSNMF